MNIPPAGGARENPEAWDKAQEESERLLEDLKKEVKAECKDIGVLRKELRVTVPAKIIADHMEHNYSELMHDAFVPGFRKGRAPRRLVEKRFGHDVRESLTTSIVGQSFYAAAENEKLDVLGEPLFRIEVEGGVKLVDIGQALEHIKLPESGDFGYVCEIELKPTFELPELKGIEIKTPSVEITEEMVDEQVLRHRKLRGRVEPASDGARKDDSVITDVILTVDGAEVKHDENVPVGVRPARLDGVTLSTLDEVLIGARPGETRTTDGVIPDDYERADLRGKTGRFEFRIHEIKRLVPETLETVVQAMGYETADEFRKDVRTRIEAEHDGMMHQARKTQVEQYLLQHTKIELPQDFSTQQTDRAVERRVVELQQRGVPWSAIEVRIDELRTQAREPVANELRLSFILEKVAEQLGAQVNDEEVNTEIARMARLYNRRFDRIRDDLQSRGLLEQLVERIRQDKCIDLLLKDAKLVTGSADKK